MILYEKSTMERKRLTITLKKSILNRVDEIIDGSKIRNRSHAIEFLLSKALPPQIKKAFILAGGEGVKMRPFTYEMPKPMIPFKGKPLLEHTIEFLRKHEIKDYLINIDYLGDQIENHFSDGKNFGVKITYVREPKPSGTAGPLIKAKNLIKEPFILIYSDILVDIDLYDFINFHASHDGLATMGLTSVKDPEEFGVAELTGHRIVAFSEKPRRPKTFSHLINAGIYIMRPDIIKYIPKQKTPISLEKQVLPKLAEENKLFGYPFSGQWFDISTPKSYEKALKEWQGD